MSERAERFSVEAAAHLDVRLSAGRVTVLEGEAGAVDVRVVGPRPESLLVEQFGDRISIHQERSGLRWESYDVWVRLPAGSGLEARLASAELEVEVDLGDVRVETASGSIRMARCVDRAQLRAASADVSLGRVRGRLKVDQASGDLVVEDEVEGGAELRSASGDVRLPIVGGSLSLTSASGDVWVGRLAGDGSMRTSSGDLSIDVFGGAELTCKSMSGDVRVGLPPGRTVDLDLTSLSGDIQQAFSSTRSPESGSVRVAVKTVSGDIWVGSAQPA